MEALLVMIFYVWAVGGLLFVLDRIPTHKGDKARFFKRED